MEHLHQQLKESMCYLTCPISCQPFSNPVVCSDGSVYSKAEIEAWWSTCRRKKMPMTSPVTNLPVSNTEVYPVRALADIIKLIKTLQKTADALAKDHERVVEQAVQEAKKIALADKEMAIKEAVEQALLSKQAFFRKEVEKDKNATCIAFMKLTSKYSREAVKWENAAKAAHAEMADIKAQVCAAQQEIKRLEMQVMKSSKPT